MITYKQIIEFGLDDKESKVFLAAMELGGENVFAIAKKANINRVATYEALESLIKKGLVSTFIKGKRTYYSATEPDRLKHLLQLEKQELTNRENVLSRLMPELKSLYNVSSSAKPKVMYYEGKAGIETIHDDILKSTDKTIRLIFLYDSAQKVFTKKEMEEYGEARIKKGLKVKSLAVIKDKNIDIHTSYKNVERGYIKYNDFPMDSDITVYGNRLAFISLNELFGVIIENKEFAKTMRSFFDLAWTISKKTPPTF